MWTRLAKVIGERNTAYSKLCNGESHFTADFGDHIQHLSIPLCSAMLQQRVKDLGTFWSDKATIYECFKQESPTTPEKVNSVWKEWLVWLWEEFEHIITIYFLTDTWSKNISDGR